MALSKKDYEAIARAIRAAYDRGWEMEKGEDRIFARGAIAASGMIGSELIEYFAKSNPRFDESKFLKAAFGDGE